MSECKTTKTNCFEFDGVCTHYHVSDVLIDMESIKQRRISWWVSEMCYDAKCCLMCSTFSKKASTTVSLWGKTSTHVWRAVKYLPLVFFFFFSFFWLHNRWGERELLDRSPMALRELEFPCSVISPKKNGPNLKIICFEKKKTYTRLFFLSCCFY